MSNHFNISTPEQKITVSAGSTREITYTITNKTQDVHRCCSNLKYISGKHLPFKIAGFRSIELQPGETTKITLFIFPSSLLNSCSSEFQLVFYSEDLPDEIYTESQVIRTEIIGREKNTPEGLSSIALVVAIAFGVITLGVGAVLSINTYKNYLDKTFTNDFIHAVYFQEEQQNKEKTKIKKRDIDYWKTSSERVEFFQYVFNIFNNHNSEDDNDLFKKSDLYKNITNEDERIDQIMYRMLNQTLLRFDNINNPELLLEIFYRITKDNKPVFNLKKLKSEIDNNIGKSIEQVLFDLETIEPKRHLSGFGTDKAIDKLGSISKYVSLYNDTNKYNFFSVDFREKSSVSKIVINDELEPYDNTLEKSISKKISELDNFYFTESENESIKEQLDDITKNLPLYIDKVLNLSVNNYSYERKKVEITELNQKITDSINVYNRIVDKKESQKEIVTNLEKLFLNKEIKDLDLDNLKYYDLDKGIHTRLVNLFDILVKLDEYYSSLKITQKEENSRYKTVIEYCTANFNDNNIDNNFVNNLIILDNIKKITKLYNAQKDAQKDAQKEKINKSIENIDDKIASNSSKNYNNYIFKSLYKSLDNLDASVVLNTKNLLHDYVMNDQTSFTSKFNENALNEIISDVSGNNIDKLSYTRDVGLKDFSVSLLNENKKVIWSTYIKNKPKGPLTLIPTYKENDIKSIKVELHHVDYLQISDLKVYRKLETASE